MKKKCSFSNDVCTKIDKSCLDLDNAPSATNEICEALPASANKKCILKPIGNGCKEVDDTENKETDSTQNGNNNNYPTWNGGNDDDGGNEDNNYGEKIHLNKLINMIFCLLV